MALSLRPSFPPNTHWDEWKMVTEGFDMLGGEEYEEKDGWSLGIKWHQFLTH